MSTNKELELAFQYVSETNRHVYLTGRAGTGKTTFLHRIRSEVAKHAVVVAPTGVAAINAKGVTIHSLFQLPFGLIEPGDTKIKGYKLNRDKKLILKSIELLIIDEISMVRADVLDAISEVLCRVRQNNEPFGGVQLLMIGDLHQLPPIVKDHERAALLKRYDTPYFFGSQRLREANLVTIELTHIYRQADAKFIDLLNRVRTSQLDKETLDLLNERFVPNHQPPVGSITLTSHNFAADNINQEYLSKLPGTAHEFTAAVEGKFPASMQPNAEQLSFKIGTQVMFNRNDPQKQYYNGKIGQITAISDDEISVTCPDEPYPIKVYPVTWENVRYEMNKETKEVEQHIIGSWTQHPLRLAWGITIHKSQGLTFERVTIDAADAFAHGQVYVALSRCKTLEGITLRSRIGDHSVKTDSLISEHSASYADNLPTAEQLESDKRRYQIRCLQEMFRCHHLDVANKHLRRSLMEYESSLQSGRPVEYRPLYDTIDELVNTGSKFVPQLANWRHPRLTTEQADLLATRVTKAGAYFTNCLTTEVQPVLEQYSFLTDNKAVKERIQEALSALRLSVFVASRIFATATAEFDAIQYGKTKTAALLDFNALTPSNKKSDNSPVPTDLRYPDMFRILRNWRRDTAEEKEVSAFIVAHNSVLINIANRLPRTTLELASINKVGPKMMERYGEAILKLVTDYVAKNNIPEEKPETNASLLKADAITPKTKTYEATHKLFVQGCTITEIAETRKLTESTILNHLARYVATGEVPITELMHQQDVDFLSGFIGDNPDAPLGYVRHALENRFSYGEIRLVMEYRTWLEREELVA